MPASPRHPVGCLRSNRAAAARFSPAATDASFLQIYLERLVSGGAADEARQETEFLPWLLRAAFAVVPAWSLGTWFDNRLCHAPLGRGFQIGHLSGNRLVQNRSLHERYDLFYARPGRCSPPRASGALSDSG